MFGVGADLEHSAIGPATRTRLAAWHHEVHRCLTFRSYDRVDCVESDVQAKYLPTMLKETPVTEIEAKQVGIGMRNQPWESIVHGTAPSALATSRSHAEPRCFPIHPSANRPAGNPSDPGYLALIFPRAGKCENVLDFLARSHRWGSEVVRRVGLEPTSPFGQWILNPSRFPDFATAAASIV